MGCCMSNVAPSTPPVTSMQKVGSYTETTTKSKGPRSYGTKQEPQMSFDSTRSSASKKSKVSESYTPVDPPRSSTSSKHRKSTSSKNAKSEFQLKMEQRTSEIMQKKQKLKQVQTDAFNQQIANQQGHGYKRLYDVWKEFATNVDKDKMDIDGLTSAVAVFGMIIDTDRDFQRHVFKKFDLDNEKEITYDDFSATMASFVGSNTDDHSLQHLFEIFDIDQDGYLELEDMARILLTQNQISLVVTGQQSESTVVYTKNQCLKQARRMVATYDSQQFNDSKISFDEFKSMMNSRTEDDMMIHHMQAPSMSIQGDGIPYFVPHNVEQ